MRSATLALGLSLDVPRSFFSYPRTPPHLLKNTPRRVCRRI